MSHPVDAARPLTWLLQANHRDQGFLTRLETVLDSLGEDWLAVDLVPFSPALPVLPFDPATRSVVCYGPSFVPRVAAHPSWRPGIFFDERSFRWSEMATHWHDLMFSPDGRVTTAAAVLEELAADPGPVFVRPDGDTKAFDGGVFEDEVTLRHHLGTADPTLPVIRATAHPIDAEWRCFVVAGKIVDSSEYRRAGRPSIVRAAPPRVLDLVETAAARWSPAPVTCIDVASSGDRFGIVEANCFSAVRFYAADPVVVVAAIASYVRATS